LSDKPPAILDSVARTPRPRSASAPTEPRPVAGFLVSDYIGDSAKHAATALE